METTLYIDTVDRDIFIKAAEFYKMKVLNIEEDGKTQLKFSVQHEYNFTLFYLGKTFVGDIQHQKGMAKLRRELDIFND